MSILAKAVTFTAPTLTVADCPVNPITWSFGSIVPTDAVAETPVNHITSAIVKLPTELVETCPVNVTTEEPNPTKVPNCDSIFNPVKIAASLGTTTEPCPDVIGNPVKSASCEVTPCAVPSDEVIANPVGDTSSFGATAVP